MRGNESVLKDRKIVSILDDRTTIYSGKLGAHHFSFTSVKIPQFQSNFLSPQVYKEVSSELRQKLSEQIYINKLFEQETILRYSQGELRQSIISYTHEKIESTLRDQIKGNNLTYPQKINIFSDIVHAVKTLHKKNLIHRLIRPQNIAICNSNYNPSIKTAKLMNFSKTIKKNLYKKLLTDEKLQHNRVKKNMYLAPEVLQNKQQSFAVDSWSLGILFYLMLFDDIGGIKITDKNVQVSCPQNTPFWVKDFIQKMLAYYPQYRYSIFDIESVVRCAQNCSHHTDIKKKNYL